MVHCANSVGYCRGTLPSLARLAPLKSLITLYINICKITFFPPHNLHMYMFIQVYPCDTTDTSFSPLVVMDQCGGTENKDKVPSSDYEDENENAYKDFILLTVVNEHSENTR